MSGDEELIRAAARNHTSWMTLGAQAAGGGPRTHGSVTWIASARGEGASLPFPEAVAGEDADAMLAACRELDASGIGCWTTGLEPIGELAAVLVARGFEWGWSAHWMAFDLDALPRVEDGRVTVGPGPLPGTWRAAASGLGQATVHVADGEAGLYDVGVEPGARRSGLGRSLTVAALRAAARHGARVATVNATEEGKPLYRSVGARSLGDGQTFWIHRAGLRNPPDPELVAAAEAAGRGHVPDRVTGQRLPGNGLGLAHVAALAGHPEVATRLVALGAPSDPLLAYDISGAGGLAAYDGPIDAPLSAGGETVLHEAVRRRDDTLLRAALDRGADREARDTQFGATPLDWAQHLGNAEAAALLRR